VQHDLPLWNRLQLSSVVISIVYNATVGHRTNIIHTDVQLVCMKKQTCINRMNIVIVMLLITDVHICRDITIACKIVFHNNKRGYLFRDISGELVLDSLKKSVNSWTPFSLVNLQ